jgi:hypothetical protein
MGFWLVTLTSFWPIAPPIFNMAPYLRRKLDKWVIEEKVEGKTVYIMTLPPLEDIIKWRRPVQTDIKASKNTLDPTPEDVHKFVYELLNEYDKTDAKPKEKKISEEDKKKLWELTK